MMTDPDTTPQLPPSVLALPQSVRDAMGMALADEIVETLNRLAAEPGQGKDGVPAYTKKRPGRGDAGEGDDPAVP